MSSADEDSVIEDALLLQEVGSTVRHGLRNHLGAIRNATYFLERRLRMIVAEAMDAEPRIAKMFALVDSELRAAETLLAPVPEVHAVLDAEVGACDAIPIIDALLGSIPGAERIRRDASLDERCLVSTTPRLLRIAVGEILVNAVEAIADGGNASIAIRLVDPGFATIEVADDAVDAGVPPDVLGFLAFQSTKEGRLGLGIARARRAAITWGGRIELERPATGGTRVLLSVPLAAPIGELR